jgi:hypothetical protein
MSHHGLHNAHRDDSDSSPHFHLAQMATLGSANSVSNGSALMQSELLLLRIPVAVGEQLLQESTDAGSSPLTSSLRGPQHLAFVRSVNHHPEGFELEVYPVVSFSHEGGAIDGYNATDDIIKPTLIPLPPLSHRFPTSQLFGPPLSIGGWENSRDAWLHVVPKKFIMPRTRTVSVICCAVCYGHTELKPSGCSSKGSVPPLL